VLVVAVVLAVPGAAAAHSPLKLAGTASGPAVSDGRRWMATPNADGTENVLDAFTGRVQRLAPPLACGPYVSPVPVLGTGLLAWSCGSDVFTGQLSDAQTPIVGLATGTVTHPVGLGAIQPFSTTPAMSVTAIGRYGMTVHKYGYHQGEDVYLDWRTGRQLGEPDARHVVDLDQPSLERRLCAPMVRTPNVDQAGVDFGGEGQYTQFTFDSPWGLTEIGSNFRSGDYLTISTLLERCGHANRRLARRSGSSVGVRFGYVLTSGLLAWFDATRLHVRRLSDGRAWSWVAPRNGVVALARQTVVLSLPPVTPSGPWHVYVARLPVGSG
jgi:hypothetical protein